MSNTRNGIYISSNGKIKIIPIDFNKPKYEDILGCEYIEGFSLPHFDPYGYQLVFMVDDFGIVKEYNEIVSRLSFKEVHGDAILVDDDIDLSLEKLIEISRILKKDYEKILEKKNRILSPDFFKDLLKSCSP